MCIYYCCKLYLFCRTRKCIIIALILLLILLYLWPSRLTFGKSGGQQFLIPHKWLSATSHPLGMKCAIYYIYCCSIQHDINMLMYAQNSDGH